MIADGPTGQVRLPTLADLETYASRKAKDRLKSTILLLYFPTLNPRHGCGDSRR